MVEIEVKGHSGCQIDIAREDRDLYIYKSSYDAKYLSRLVKQAQKQQKAAVEEYQHVRIPQIYSIDQDEKHVSVKMEYVYSRNFVEYFESAGFEQINYFIKALILFIGKELKVSPVQKVPTKITIDKYNDVVKNINSNKRLKEDLEIQNLLQLTKKMFDDMAELDSIEIPLGLCHGDLTFSNILFNGNNYYLIDFLDSFLESPLMDIVKIRQDSSHMWSQLMYIKPYDNLRLKIICEKIDFEIDKYFSRYDWYRRYYHVFQVLNLLRILQYAKEDKVILFLKKELNKLVGAEPYRNKSNFDPISKSNRFSLIIPIAANDEEHPDMMPYVFNLDSTGMMLCIRAVQGLNLDVFDDVYFTILRKHAEKFCLDEMFKLQFKRLGMKNAHLVIIDNPTTSQSETVYKTILKASITGSIFIKDADGYFNAIINKENSVAVFPLEQMNMVDPQHKSYVSVDDMSYITNIIEKRVISHYFNVGGVCFEDTSDFLHYYFELSTQSHHICMSHIVYAMLLDNQKFRPVITDDYIDWGNEQLLKYHQYG